MIHTTADFSYRDTLTITDGAIEKAKEEIRRGLPIITDTTMVASGINKTAAGKFGIEVHCFIGDEDVKAKAKESGMTRSAVSVEKAAGCYPECIYAVGNAPTALMRLYELIEEKRFARRSLSESRWDLSMWWKQRADLKDRCSGYRRERTERRQ